MLLQFRVSALVSFRMGILGSSFQSRKALHNILLTAV